MIHVEPDETASAIREWLREHPEIAKEKYNATHGSVEGHCYVASEAYFYADGGEDSDLDPHCLSWENGGTHWFLQNSDNGEIIDLSIEQREDGYPIPYGEATRRAFITGYTPSQRAETINEALDLW